MSTPNTGIPYVPENTLDPAAGLNLALNVIDALLQTRVLSMALTAPPGSPANGDLYIPAAPATGDWLGLEDHLVRYVSEGDFWQDYAPGVQVHLVLNIADGGFYKYIPGSPGGWVLAAGLGDAPSDGGIYGRQDGAWVSALMDFINEDVSPEELLDNIHTTFLSGFQITSISPGVARLEVAPSSSLTITDADSPPTVSVANVQQLIIGNNLTLTEVDPGIAQIVATGGGGSGNASVTPDDHPSSPNAMDDEFEAGSLDAKWTWVNQGTSTITFAQGSAILAGQADAGTNLRGIEQPVSGTGRWRIKLSGIAPNNFNLFAVGLRNTSNSRLWTFYPIRVGNTFGIGYWTNLSTFSSEPVASISRATEWGSNREPVYVEIEITATQFIARMSKVGVDGSFEQIGAQTITDFVGAGYDRIGIYANSQSGSTGATGYIEWFRRMA